MKSFLFFLLIPAFASFAQGQDYYTPGESYAFRSRSLSTPNKTHIIHVRFDAQGKAYLRRSTEDAQSDDIPQLHIMVMEEECFYTFEGIEKITIEIRGELSNYWLIPVDGNGQPQNLSAHGNDNSVEVICHCVYGDGTCSVAFHTGDRRRSACMTCVPNVGCMDCRMQIKKGKGLIIEGGAVLLKASSVEWE